MIPIAFIAPNFPSEERVSLLPEDVATLRENGYAIEMEHGFGRSLNIDDSQYQAYGVQIKSREECYQNEIVFNLKLTQPCDYKYLRENQTIIGWTHPTGSGFDFYQEIAIPKNLKLFDLDSVYPKLYDGKMVSDLVELPSHCFWENSYLAGQASVKLAQMHQHNIFTHNTNIAILGSGSVSQGAFYEVSTLGIKPRMFYRKTLHIFKDLIHTFDIIVNGIEIDTPEDHIICRDDLLRTKQNVLIIDAAADAGCSIFGTEYQSFEDPIGYTLGRKYILVNNAPTLLKLEASRVISRVISRNILPRLTTYLAPS